MFKAVIVIICFLIGSVFALPGMVIGFIIGLIIASCVGGNN